MEMGDRVCEGVADGREGMEAPHAWSDEGCAQHRQESWWAALPGRCSSRKQHLCCLKGKGTPQLPLGSQNSRDNRGTIPWTMAHRPCLEAAIYERGEIHLQICWVNEAGHGNLGGIKNTTKCRKRS